jgi:hypothetical protein
MLQLSLGQFNSLTFFSFRSAKNLEKDTFLKERMDEQGWVPLTLIAGFKKVRLHAQLDQWLPFLRVVPIFCC